MRFTVLGPVRVTCGDAVVRIDRAQRRAVLAYLVLNTGQAVSLAALVDALWGDCPPQSSKSQIHAAVSVVRRALRAAGGDPIVSEPGGYRLMASADQVDLLAFAEGVAHAQACVAESDPERAAHLLQEALGLWHSEPLSGITAAFADDARAHLRERYLTAFELLADVELSLSRHHDLVPRLTVHAAANPVREKLTGQLMLGLFRCGRQADALAAYQTMRGVLADELGIDPTPDLQRLHRRILNNDAELAAPAPADPRSATRRFLPGDIPDFTGRSSQMSTLDAIAQDMVSSPATVIISAIAGTGGVGKTALAVRWAHRATARFPDGQLHVNLRGYDPRSPLTPVDALGQLLRALRVPPEQVPHDVDEASALYRSKVANLRLLIVLDNARSVEQVRPLLPSGPGSMALITSRDKLSGLVAREGARRLTLDILAPGEATELLSRIVGAERAAAEPQAIAELAATCGYLPLALRIAASNIYDRPHLNIAEHVRDLDADRIGELAVDGDPDSAIRIVFGYSYRYLSTVEQQVFRMLGVVPGVDFTAEAVAALTGLAVQDCVGVLDRLAAGHLVNSTDGRHTLHDLVRAYAASLAAEQERRQAVEGWLTWLLYMAEDAAKIVSRQQPIRLHPSETPPSFTDADHAFAWWDAERVNLVTAVEYAAQQGYPNFAWQTAYAIRIHLMIRRARAELMRVATAALGAAESLADQRALATAELAMATANHLVDRNREAVVRCGRAIALADSLGWTALTSIGLKSMHLFHLQLSELDEAAAYARRSLELEFAQQAVTAQDYGRLALVDMQRGALAPAAASFEEALRLGEQTGAVYINVITRLNLGETYRLLGRPHDAEEQLNRALGQAAEVDNQHITAVALSNLACALRDMGQLPAALARAGQALELLRQVNDDVAMTNARHAHATTLTELGQLDEAVRELEVALVAAQHREITHPKTEVLLALAEAHIRRNDVQQAWAYATEARELAERGEFRVLYGHSLNLLVDLHLREGRPEAAEAVAEEAIRVHVETGYLPGRQHLAEIRRLDS